MKKKQDIVEANHWPQQDIHKINEKYVLTVYWGLNCSNPSIETFNSFHRAKEQADAYGGRLQVNCPIPTEKEELLNSLPMEFRP